MNPPDDMQPIETAPKDGTPIVVFRPGYGLYAVRWNGKAWEFTRGRTISDGEVTHWRPL